MTLICKYKQNPIKIGAEELGKRLENTAGPEKARDRALLLLEWSGRLTAEYLAKDTGVEPWLAAHILKELAEEGECEIITLLDL